MVAGSTSKGSDGLWPHPLLQGSFAKNSASAGSGHHHRYADDAEKGIPTLLKAAAMVHRVHPDVSFLLVGPRESEGPLAVTQAEIDQHAPYVMATGPRSDVPALLRLADLFAFPTAYGEGVPRVLLEAALAGVPIVSTSMPGCCEVVRDGWSGSLVPPHAPESLARASSTCLVNARRRK